jgi:hypothetical protein
VSMTAIFLLIVASTGASSLGTTPAAPRVEGVLAGKPEELRSLEAALRKTLARQGLALIMTTAARIDADKITRVADGVQDAARDGEDGDAHGGSERVVARFRLDLTSSSAAKLYLLDGERRRVYVRWLSLPRGLDPVAVELMCFIVESSIEAIRAGQAIGVSREEYDRSLSSPIRPPAALPPVPPPALATSPPVLPPRRSPSLGLVAAVRYEGTLMARGRYQHGPGISLALRLLHLWIGADLLARIPMTLVGDAAEARIQAGAFRITGAVPLVSSPQASVAAGIGGGVDVSRIQPAASRFDLVAASAFWATSPFLRLFVAVERDFGRLSIAAVAGLDIDLLGEHYVVAEAAGNREVAAPQRARPLAALLLGWRR